VGEKYRVIKSWKEIVGYDKLEGVINWGKKEGVWQTLCERLLSQNSQRDLEKRREMESLPRKGTSDREAIAQGDKHEHRRKKNER